MSFELLDNALQVLVLAACCAGGLTVAYRRRNRHVLMLAFGHACFAMGALFYVLHLAVVGYVPQVFYVAEISWLAAYLFYLSLQIDRTADLKVHFSPLAAAGAVAAAVCVLRFQIFGPSYFMSGCFALTAGALVYLSLFRLQSGAKGRRVDICLLVCVTFQLLVYIVSMFMTDYTRFNAYFAVDLSLTACLAALLPLTMGETE